MLAVRSARSLLHRPPKQSKASFSTAATVDLSVDNVVIGGGVVGLALAERLTRTRSQETTVLIERNKQIGQDTSSRNSEVIHAGIYYPIDSLKTRLCIRGKEMLYDVCEKHKIPHRKIGKWVVGHDEEQHLFLKELHQKSEKLGVPTSFLSESEIAQQEPQLRARYALFSPTTGIVDSHSLMEYLEGRVEEQGGMMALNTTVQNITAMDPHQSQGRYHLEIVTPPDLPTTVQAMRVFNAAGLYADAIANLVTPASQTSNGAIQPYKLHYAKGHYFGYRPKNIKVNHLIYPCPEKNLAGLGTHLTLDLEGRVRFGPDVKYVKRPDDYGVSEERLHEFYEAIRAYLPDIIEDGLFADYAGIRPKLSGPGEPFRDFLIKEDTERNLAGFYNLVGIESPGLTSALAIAEYVDQELLSE